MEKKKVFISCSKEDIAYAKWLGSVFEINGVTATVSDYNNYDVERATACIDEADAFVSLYSKNTKQIDNQSTETEHAFNAKKNIFPVIIDKCNIEGQYNYYLSFGERFEIYKNKSKTLKLLIGQIKNADENEKIKIKNYHVDLLSEQEIDDVISGKKENLSFFKKLSPFSRLYSKNSAVRYALKCYTAIFAIPMVAILGTLVLFLYSEITNLLLGDTINIYYSKVVALVFGFLVVLGLWNLAYLPSILIAKLKLKNKFVILALVLISILVPGRMFSIV